VLAIVFKKFCQASVPGFHIPMKVIVNVCYCGAKVKSGDGHRLSLAVKPSDTVLRLKQRVMLVEPVSFPEQAQARPVPATELGMLYSHKCGGSVKHALTILGCTDFLANQKQFSVQESGLVSLAELPSPVVETPVTVTAAVVVKSTLGNVVRASVDLKIKDCQTVQSFYDRVAAAELIPFQASKVSLDGQVLEGHHQLSSYIKQGATVEVCVNISKDMLVQQLAGLLNGRRLSVTELGDLYCYRYGVPVSRALELLGRRSTLKEFLKDNVEHFCMDAGCVMQKQPSNNTTATTLGGLNQTYLDPQSEIASGKSIQDAEACLELAIKSATAGIKAWTTTLSAGKLIK